VRVWQMEGLRELADAAEKMKLHVVCSAVIHDDLFRQVRVWVRQGFTGAQVQAELDTRFQYVIKQMAESRKRLQQERIVEDEIQSQRRGSGGSSRS